MRDIPILFSRPMVHGLLREVEAPGTGKTQTRRIIKMPDADFDAVFCEEDGAWNIGDALTGKREHKLPVRFRKGDRLWVKETWRTEARYDDLKPALLPTRALISYDAGYEEAPNDGCRGRTRVSIHMVRRASRLTLTVTDVRVQRLQEISDTDCSAEGANSPGGFQLLWEDINGMNSWWANPWVVAVTFTVALRNIDHVFPSSPRLSPDGTYCICDQCHREWKPGESPNCESCDAAFRAMGK